MAEEMELAAAAEARAEQQAQEFRQEMDLAAAAEARAEQQAQEFRHALEDERRAAAALRAESAEKEEASAQFFQFQEEVPPAWFRRGQIAERLQKLLPAAVNGQCLLGEFGVTRSIRRS